MADESKGFPLPLPQLAALLMFVAGLLMPAPPPLATTRPKSLPVALPAEPESGLRARLWQDPLAVVQKARESSTGETLDKEARARLETLRTELAENVEDKLVLAVCVQGDSAPEWTERRLRMRTAVLSGLGRAGYVPKSTVNYVLVPYQKPACPAEVPCIGLPAPRPPGLEVAVTVERLEVQFSQKWLSTVPGVQQVVLLWIFDDYPGTSPFTLLHRIGDEVWGDMEAKTRRVRVLGPSNTTSFTAFAESVRYAEEGPPSLTERRAFAGVEMIAGLPTVSPEMLELISRRPEKEGELPKPGDFKRGLDKLGIYLRRTILTDDVLADEMIVELMRRGIHVVPTLSRDDGAEPPECAKIKVTDSAGEAADDVAIVSDWDTSYGRAWPLMLRMAVQARQQYSKGLSQARRADLMQALIRYPLDQKIKPDVADQLLLPANVHVFAYMKGLDGVSIGPSDAKTSGSAKPEAASAPSSSGATTVERALGESQADYLRRLAQHLKSLDDRLRARGRHLQAVMVVGSDLYDKLMVMRAIRPRLRDVLFLTNNVDADMLAADELAGTRNLVVASPFGLRLRPFYQAGIPPFRDGYQTASFCSTLAAMRVLDPVDYPYDAKTQAFDDSRPSLWWQSNRDLEPPPANVASDAKQYWRPRMFEVGKDKFIDLALPPKLGDPFAVEADFNFADSPTASPQAKEKWSSLHSTPEHPESEADRRITAAIWVLSMLVVMVIFVQLFRATFDTRGFWTPLGEAADKVLTTRWQAYTLAVLVAFGMPEVLARLDAVIGMVAVDWQWLRPWPWLQGRLPLLSGEPYSWFDGVSVWPAHGWRLGAVVMVAHFMFRMRSEFKRREDLARETLFRRRVRRHAVDRRPPPMHLWMWALRLLWVCLPLTVLIGLEIPRLQGWLVPASLLAVCVMVIDMHPFVGSAVESKLGKWWAARWKRVLGVVLAMAGLISCWLPLALQLRALIPANLIVAAVALLIYATHIRRAARMAGTPDSTVVPHRLWKRLSRLNRRRRQWLRVMLLTASLLWTVVTVLAHSPLPQHPARGGFAIVCETSTFGLGLLALCAIIATVVDVVLIESAVSRCIRIQRSEWIARRTRNVPFFIALGHAAHHVLDMRFLRLRSHPVAEIVYAPFVVLGILLLAQSKLFDSYHMHIPLLGLWASFLIITCLTAWVLHQEAVKAQGAAVRALQAYREDLASRQILRPASVSKDRLTLIDQCLTEIRGMKDGVFAPFWEQPFVKAIFFSGGIGGLTSIVGAMPSLIALLK